MLDRAQVERDFAVLLTEGWPVLAHRERSEPRTGLGLLPRHLLSMAAQMIYSEVPETRHYWRTVQPTGKALWEAECRFRVEREA